MVSIVTQEGVVAREMTCECGMTPFSRRQKRVVRATTEQSTLAPLFTIIDAGIERENIEEYG